MTMRRMLVMAGGAVVPIALISLLLGNQWVIDAISDTGLHWDEGLAPPLYWLFFPSWRLTPGDYAWEQVVVLDIGVVLFFVLLILLAVAGARAVDARRGAIGAAVTGWWATVVAGGIAGFVTGVLMRWALDIHSDSGPFIFGAVTRGASFGFAYGWLAGIGMLLGFLMTRGRDAAAQQPGQPGRPGQYALQQPAMPMQQPYGQPARQQGVPYVPQQAQPQQPWGGMPQQPVPQQYQQQPYQQPYQQPQYQQPQPQQYGTPPVPPQPSAPASEQVPPAAPEAPDEPEQDAPEGTDGNAGADAPKDDDLGLDDRTIVDRKRDGGDA